jgi:hypothetical protein
MMQSEGAFPRLVEIIQGETVAQEHRLHRLLLDVIYEMSRIQRLTWEDLSKQNVEMKKIWSSPYKTNAIIASVDDAFVLHLFEVIEQASDDVNDPYHYPIIRVLVYSNAFDSGNAGSLTSRSLFSMNNISLILQPQQYQKPKPH